MEQGVDRVAAVQRDAIELAKNTIAAKGEAEGVNMENILTKMEQALPSPAGDVNPISALVASLPSPRKQKRTKSMSYLQDGADDEKAQSAPAPEAARASPTVTGLTTPPASDEDPANSLSPLTVNPLVSSASVQVDQQALTSNEESTAAPVPPNPPGPQITEAQARERARQRILLAKRVGVRVKFYKSLEQVHLTWMQRQAWSVMTDEELKKTKTVRGLLRRTKNILNPNLEPISVPDSIVRNLAYVLQVRSRVSDEYRREQQQNPDPELEAANQRHQFYQECLSECLVKLVEYQSQST